MRHLIIIILFGAIWGLFEATLGGVLHIARLPFTGTIMASIGFTILYSAMKAGAKPSHLFAVGLIAASFKLLDAPLFGLPLADRTIVNPALAIASQGLACAVVLRNSSLHEGWPKLSLRFLGAAAIATVIFNGVSLGAFGWETNQTKHAIETALIHVPIMAIAPTVLSRVLVDRMNLHMSMAWQATAAAGAVVLAFAAKIFIH